jgi:hypothetical protein
MYRRMNRTSTTFALTAGMRSALFAEAERRGTTPSLVLEALLVQHLPEFIAAAVREAVTQEPADHRPDQELQVK